MAQSQVLQLTAASSQAVNIGNSSITGLDMTGDFTLEVFLKADSRMTVDGERVIMQIWQNVDPNWRWRYVRISGTTYIEIQIRENGTANENVVRWERPEPLDHWEHLAITSDINELPADQFELFVNGISQGNGTVIVGDSVSDPPGMNQGTGRFIIGSINNRTSDFWDGKVAQARVWDDIRTPAEIAANIETDPTPASEPNLQGYWKFDGTLLDETSNNNDLTADNGAGFVDGTPFEDQLVDAELSPVGNFGEGVWERSDNGDFIEVGNFGGSVNIPPPVNGDFIEIGNFGASVGERSEDACAIVVEPEEIEEIDLPVVSLSTIEVLSKTTLLLTFNRTMTNNEELTNVDNYVISLVSGSVTPSVTSVLSGTEDFVNQVVVQITPPEIGSVFSVNVTGNITSADGGTLDPAREAVQFESRFTKMDSVLSHLTSIYTTKPGSILRNLLHAITREDDRIGGSREDFLE